MLNTEELASKQAN